MLRVRVFAAHMDGFLGPKFSNKSPFFGRFSLNMGLVFQKLPKIAKIGSFQPKFIIKEGITVITVN